MDVFVACSKSCCGFCQRVKQLLSELGATYQAIELDLQSDGNEIQSTLQKKTGKKTVPQVFIGGKFVGGCDDVFEMYKSGSLVALLHEAGAIANSANAAQL
ncbi:Glutaredoxin [Dillenia turbinata]|uniref:Glutaredoxin n=1 Tax=Dillenia turbinata TaxID=194707 RepID=A0AAN8UXJ3_9MAGN